MKWNKAFPAKWKSSLRRETPTDNPTCAPCFQAELWLIWLWLDRFMPVLLNPRWKFFFILFFLKAMRLLRGITATFLGRCNLLLPHWIFAWVCFFFFYTARVCQSKWKPCSLVAAFINNPAYLLSMFISFVASIHLVEACMVRGFMCFLGITGFVPELWHHVGFPQQTRNPWLECLWAWG